MIAMITCIITRGGRVLIVGQRYVEVDGSLKGRIVESIHDYLLGDQPAYAVYYQDGHESMPATDTLAVLRAP